MPITIGSNISSLRAQRSLTKQADNLASIFQRLSSGSRINKAADDAAGLAIADALKSDTRVYSQGVRNLNDGISYLNIADGALNQLSNVVVRIREIAEQAANGVYSTEQRKALQEEVTSLQAEYNRIIKSTEFNGQQILTGENTKVTLQGGYGTDESLSIQVGDTKTEDLTRIDTSSDGTLSNGSSLSERMGVSADGRFVAFQSNATNLVAGDANGSTDIFIKDMLTGTTKLVSTDSSGNQGNDNSEYAGISADGRFVAFTSRANNLVAGDTNGEDDIFLKDTLTGEIKLVSTDSLGNQGNNDSSNASISGDGRFVVFTSRASNLVAGDTNARRDTFIKDTLTGEIERVSTDSSGNQGNNNSIGHNGVSADGRFVVFSSHSTNLVTGDTNGSRDVFVKDTLTGETKRVNTDSSGNEGNGNSSYSVNISANGRFVSFNSNSTNLVAGDTNGVTDIFVKDILTEETKRISTDSSGNQGNGNSYSTSISADGRFVAFTSNATNLITGDTNANTDVFIKDTLTEETKRVANLSPVFGLPDYPHLSADGRHLFFHNFSNDDIHYRDLRENGIQEISAMVVSNQASAKITLDLAKNYQDEITSYRAGIGTAMSRTETFINTLQTASENYKSAESQITDSDIAKESSNLIRSNILQQTASAVLAQANQQPALILQLL